MHIILSEAFKEYQKKKNFTSVTVTSCSTGGSCCKAQVSKVKIGEPETSKNTTPEATSETSAETSPDASFQNYNVFHDQGLTFYISKSLKLENTLTFTYDKMLGRELIEMHGYVIQRYCDLS